MPLKKHWSQIKSVLTSAQKSTMHCAIASVDQNNIPNITPIGTVFLRDNQCGYYFDSYTSQLADNLKSNANVCLMAVNANKSYWFMSFLKGRFKTPPGVRLYGTVGELRLATPEELNSINTRIKPMRWLKGSKLLWSEFTHVRDIQFTSFRPVSYPKMVDHLWQ